jgi:hypothetical protein
MAASSKKKAKRSLADLDVMDKSYELVNTLKGFHNALNSYQLKDLESIPKGVVSQDEVFAVLILKFGYKCIQSLDEAIRSVPLVFSTNRIHYIHDHFLHLYPDHK